ncbi:Lysine (K)-specific demethylase 6B [Balamuthia mandrillaris]
MKKQQQDRSDRLKGLRVALGPCFDSDYAQKRDLKNLITNHGASFTYIVNAETTHLLSTEEEVRAQPLKIRTARKYKVLIVSKDWLLESTIGKEGATPPLERKEGWRYALDPLDKIEQFNLRSLPAARSYVLRFMREGLTSIAALQLQLSSTQQPQQQQQQKKALTIDLSADDQKNEEEVEEGWKEVLNRRQRQNKEQRQKEMEAKQLLALKKAKRAKARALNDEAQRREDLRRFKQEIKEKDRLQRREERLQRLEERWRLELERRHQRWKAKSDVADEKRRAWEERQAERRRRIEEKERKRREWQESKEARERLKLEWQRKIEEWEEMRRQETGKKLFVGGWTFDDLTEEVLGSESLVLFTKKKRIDVIKEQIFEERFPYIVKWKGEQWDTLDSSASTSLQPEEPQNVSSSEGTNGEEKPQKKSKGNFFFIVFDTPEHAQECFAALHAFQSKAEICSTIKKRLLENGDSPLYAPHPTFYVRWPKKEPPTAISVRLIPSYLYFLLEFY